MDNGKKKKKNLWLIGSFYYLGTFSDIVSILFQNLVFISTRTGEPGVLQSMGLQQVGHD